MYNKKQFVTQRRYDDDFVRVGRRVYRRVVELSDRCDVAVRIDGTLHHYVAVAGDARMHGAAHIHRFPSDSVDANGGQEHFISFLVHVAARGRGQFEAIGEHDG